VSAGQIAAALSLAGRVLALCGAAPAQSPAATPCCASLEEVRTNIDRIDAAIVALMAERSRYVGEAARFKPDAARVHDGARVERIIDRVKQLAAAGGLPPDVAEATFRAMISAFTEYEKTLVKH
jgi:isochorismate pyruvate lyase